MKFLFSFVALLSSLIVLGQDFELDDVMDLDEGGSGNVKLFAEAEDFELSGGWKVVELPEYAERGTVGALWPWYEDIKKAPHSASGLRYVGQRAGSAKYSFDLPHEGTWCIWVRHGKKAEFAINGEKLTLMCAETGEWSWSCLKAEAKKGAFALTVSSETDGTSVDCVVMTDDSKYEPDVRDFNKLLIRIRYGKENETSAVFPGGFHEPDYAVLKPGESTDWIDISKKFVYGVTQGIDVTARPKKSCEKTYFEVDLSWDGKVVDKTFPHHGRGAVVRGLVCTARKGLMSDVEMSATDLKRAHDVAKERAKMPKRFGVSSTMALDWNKWNPDAVENEMEVFRILGLNGLCNASVQNDYAVPFPDIVEDSEFIWDCNHGCICSPDEERIRAVAEKVAARNSLALAEGKKVFWGIMDEVMWGMNKAIECKSTTKICSARFREYLAENGLKPADFGATDWPEVELVKDYNAGLRYYWTARYRDHVVASFFATVTKIAREVHPNLCPTANMGTELVYEGNLLRGGMNLFELCNTGSMRHILTEDWANEQRTYQHCSYQCDVLRAAGRRLGVSASMLNIISGRSDWEIAAKAFSEAGRGIKSINFFRYGPDYSGASDASNKDPRIYKGIRAFCDATAAVEKYLMDGTPLKGDAALLLSVTGDRWRLLDGINENGKERMALSLMLNHLGVRTDVLGEDDLFDRLQEYRQLFVTDRNIRRECIKPLCDWLEKGGVLIAGPGALEADEANKPIDFGQFEKAGKVIRYEFSPMSDYLFKAEPREKSIYSKVSYPEEPRNKLEKIIREAGIVSAVKTSDPLVEAQIVDSPRGRLLVISNWRCEPVKVTVSGTAIKKPVDVDIGYGEYLVLE